MNKVTTINLNGIAYQVEESGYDAIAAYLKQASAKLEGNPDKDEIMRDFEQAVADKFQTYLSATKNVVTTEEVQKVIDAMGPVEGDETAEEKTPNETSYPRRLYRIHEGSFLLGVCTGFAAYFNIDVTLVRIIFILLGILTSGGAILGYFLIAILTPQAATIAEAEAGNSRPFNASEFIREAQKNYEFAQAYRSKREWKRWKRAMRYGATPTSTVYPTGGYYLFPFINLLRLVVFLLFLGAAVSVVSHHTLFGVALPLGLPLWLAIVLLFIVWQLVTAPLRWIKYQQYAAYMPSKSPYYSGRDMFWHTLASILWITVLAIAAWYAYLYIPFVHAVFTEIAAKIQAS